MIVKGNNPNNPIGRIESQQPHFCRHPDLFLLHLEISHFCEDASLSDGPEHVSGYGVSACRVNRIDFFFWMRTNRHLRPYADPCLHAPVRRSVSAEPP
jgi:hypothetical protein